jgi:hypothetical protein
MKNGQIKRKPTNLGKRDPCPFSQGQWICFDTDVHFYEKTVFEAQRPLKTKGRVRVRDKFS